MIASVHDISIFKVPLAATCRSIVLEFSFVIVAVRKHPFPPNQLVFMPLASEAHRCLVEDVGALSVLLAVDPLAGIDIFVWVGVQPFTFLLAFFKLA
jgi:hypothetical protein